MKRHIPHLHSTQQTVEIQLDGLFLVHVDKLLIAGTHKNLFWLCNLSFSNQNSSHRNPFPPGSTVQSERSGN